MEYPYFACSNCAAASFTSGSVRFTKAKPDAVGSKEIRPIFFTFRDSLRCVRKTCQETRGVHNNAQKGFRILLLLQFVDEITLNFGFRRRCHCKDSNDFSLFASGNFGQFRVFMLAAEKTQREFSGCARKQISEFRLLPFRLKDERTE